MKIQHKLFLILFSFSLLLVTALVLLIQWSIGKGMVEYVNSKEIETLNPLITELASEYQKEDSWSTLQGQHQKFAYLLFSKQKGNRFMPPPPEFGMRPEFKPSFAQETVPSPYWKRPPLPPPEHASYALLDRNEDLVAGYYNKNAEYSHVGITVAQRTVGFLAVIKRERLAQGYELDFIEQQRSYLWLIALTVMLLVVLLTLPLARHLVEPIRRITQGMHKLTQGQYQQQIVLQRQDELGELSRDFNELALTLYENDQARKRWLANISHELRTPVAILRGELEAMLDNVRPLSKKNIASANDEVKHLQSLIDDLHQLTSADIGGMHYRKQIEDLAFLLHSESDKYNRYLAHARIILTLEIEKKVINIFADKTRLLQLFDNLIQNCIKYAQASRVKITLVTDESSANPQAIIKVEDDGVGVAAAHLPHLFEYLYRVDHSRNRKTGGTGLGLSISAHIVAAHQGAIVAEHSGLGGLAIIITLPLAR